MVCELYLKRNTTKKVVFGNFHYFAALSGKNITEGKMLRFSKKVEYALIAMLEVAGQDDYYPTPTKAIASRYRIPVEVLGKVLQTLTRSGLLISIQGIKGGYKLNAQLDQITLLEVVEAIDGPLSIVSCCYKVDCAQEENCNIKNPMFIVQEKLADFFRKITLIQLEKKYQTKKINEIFSESIANN